MQVPPLLLRRLRPRLAAAAAAAAGHLVELMHVPMLLLRRRLAAAAAAGHLAELMQVPLPLLGAGCCCPVPAALMHTAHCPCYCLWSQRLLRRPDPLPQCGRLTSTSYLLHLS